MGWDTVREVINTAGGSVRRALFFVLEPLSLQRDTRGRLGGDETGPNMFCPRGEKHCWRLGGAETGPNMFCLRAPTLYTTKSVCI